MKHNNVLPVTILSLALLLAAQSEARALPETAAGTAVPSSDTGMPAQPESRPQMDHTGMMHKGKSGHGKGHGGGKHAGGHQGKGHGKHAQVVQRLDMIEARLAKIEAMLEILIRR